MCMCECCHEEGNEKVYIVVCRYVYVRWCVKSNKRKDVPKMYLWIIYLVPIQNHRSSNVFGNSYFFLPFSLRFNHSLSTRNFRPQNKKMKQVEQKQNMYMTEYSISSCVRLLLFPSFFYLFTYLCLWNIALSAMYSFWSKLLSGEG